MSHKIECREWQQRVTAWAAGEVSGDAGKMAAAHVASCGGCARLVSDLQAMDGVLRTLPVRQPSAMFDAKLAGRIAVLEDARRGQSWWQKLGQGWRRAARPALALGACAAALVGVATFQHPSVTAGPTGVAGPSVSDTTLLAHCVEQHRTDASAQPLSDPAAQNLASRLDDTSTGAADTTLVGDDGL